MTKNRTILFLTIIVNKNMYSHSTKGNSSNRHPNDLHYYLWQSWCLHYTYSSSVTTCAKRVDSFFRHASFNLLVFWWTLASAHPCCLMSLSSKVNNQSHCQNCKALAQLVYVFVYTHRDIEVHSRRVTSAYCVKIRVRYKFNVCNQSKYITALFDHVVKWGQTV